MFKDLDPIDFSFVLFSIFVGSGVSFALGKNEENLSIAKRLYVQFSAFFLFGILAIPAMTKLKWSVEYVAVFGFILSIGGQKLIHLAWQAYEENKSWIEFFQLVGKAVAAFYKVFTTVQKGPDAGDDEPQAPPTT